MQNSTIKNSHVVLVIFISIGLLLVLAGCRSKVAVPETKPVHAVAQATPTAVPTLAPVSRPTKLHKVKLEQKYFGSWVVRAGDTLYEIAGKVYGDPLLWPSLWWINENTLVNPDWLEPGDEFEHMRKLSALEKDVARQFARDEVFKGNIKKPRKFDVPF